MPNELFFVLDTNVVVSGDKDLLELHPFRGIMIVRPNEFLNLSWEE